MAKQKIKKIVFVCTGNTCRSPMAEAAFSAEIRLKNLSAAATSAGIRVSPDERDMNEKAVKALENIGLSLPYFSSTSLTKETLLAADVILCMTRAQCELLQSARKKFLDELPEGAKKPRSKNNVFCFADLTGEDVPDPYGKDEKTYAETLHKIIAAFPAIEEKWFTKKTRNAGATRTVGAAGAVKTTGSKGARGGLKSGARHGGAKSAKSATKGVAKKGAKSGKFAAKGAKIAKKAGAGSGAKSGKAGKSAAKKNNAETYGKSAPNA
mgnify:FL=1